MADVSDAEAVEQAAQDIERKLGPIDVWVNNAMVSVISPVHEMEPADYKRVTDVLYLGFVHGTVAGNTGVVFMPAAQLINPTKVDRNGRRLIGYTVRGVPGASGNDDLRLVFR